MHAEFTTAYGLKNWNEEWMLKVELNHNRTELTGSEVGERGGQDRGPGVRI